MSSPFLGEIRAWACNFPPYGWAFCRGQLLSISQASALFSLLGTNYGGNGTTNFALPDLQGRVPLKFGTDSFGDVYNIGEKAGTETITLIGSNMPMHTHTVFGTSATANLATPQDKVLMGTHNKHDSFYAVASAGAALTTINPGTVSAYAGGGLPHTNIQPFLAINWCIALNGIFPSRN